MRYRFIRITFKAPLNESQEEMLYANLDEAINSVSNKFKVMKNELDHGYAFKAASMVSGVGNSAGVIKAYLDNMILKLSIYVYREKENPTSYRFVWAHDMLALMKFKGFRVSPIQERVFVDGLKRFVLPDMGLTKHDAEFERGEFETDTEAEGQGKGEDNKS